MSTSKRFEYSIVIRADGSFFIKRDEKETNDVIIDVLEDIVKDPKELKDFMSQWQDREIFFGDRTLCG